MNSEIEDRLATLRAQLNACENQIDECKSELDDVEERLADLSQRQEIHFSALLLRSTMVQPLFKTLDDSDGSKPTQRS